MSWEQGTCRDCLVGLTHDPQGQYLNPALADLEHIGEIEDQRKQLKYAK